MDTEEWKRFESVKTHINEVNRGIPNNANQGLLLCEGSYIKLIAADDILREECIQKNLDICEKIIGTLFSQEWRHLIAKVLLERCLSR